MPFRRELGSLFQSFAMRALLWFTLLTMAATGIALTVQWLINESELRKEVVDTRNLLFETIVAEIRHEGIDAGTRIVMQNSKSPLRSDLRMLIRDGNGRIVAGDGSIALPFLTSPPKGYPVFQRSGSGVFAGRLVAVDQRVLPQGYVITLVIDADEIRVLRLGYWRVLFVSLAVILLSGLGLGYFLAARAQNFVEEFSNVARGIGRSAMPPEMPVSFRQSEYDRIAVLMNEATADVARMTSALRAATDSMAHDLKTPLSHIRSRVELGLADKQLPDATRKVMERCIDDVDGLLRQINGILQIARFEATTAEQFVPVDLADLMAEVQETFEPLAENRAIAISSTLTPAIVDAAPPLVLQALANAMDNAIRYTAEGGHIWLATGTSPSGCYAEVRDNGPGIAAADCERAQMRFVRLDHAPGDGTGLGLSVIAAVARAHRAKLTLDDAAPGLRLRLLFPAPSESVSTLGALNDGNAGRQ